MIRKLSFLLIICLISGSIASQGIDFFHGSWEEALQKAYEEEKVIFVDAYTTWCGPCKTMAKFTFTDEEVGNFFNDQFINIKMDMEKEEGLSWRRKYPVSAYPTLYFIDPEGEVVLKSVGGKKPADLLTLGAKASKGNDTSKKYAEKYADGDRSYDLMYKYVKALNKAKKPSLKIANEYLKSQSDITTEENLKFILEAAIQVDSRIFEQLETHKNAIIKVTSEEAVNERILLAANNTVQKAIEFEAESILIEAQEKVKKHLPQEADRFSARSAMDYALAMRDEESYEKHIKGYIKKHVADDAKALINVAQEIDSYFGNRKSLMLLAEKAASSAYELDESLKNAIAYASLLDKNGDTPKAIHIIDDQIEKSKENRRAIKQLKEFKKSLQNS